MLRELRARDFNILGGRLSAVVLRIEGPFFVTLLLEDVSSRNY